MPTIGNRMQRRAWLGLSFGAIGATTLIAAGLQGFGAPGENVVNAAARAATIKIDNFAFTPPDLTVAAGTTVTWRNEDDSPHRVTENNNGFSSVALDTDDSFSHTFTKPGIYKYFCSIHPYMVGKIVVKPARPPS
jgi:plastocyanin